MRTLRLVVACALTFVIACGPSGRPGGGGGGGSDSDGGTNNGDGCSSDLHNVVDMNGNVVQTCPNDQGCAAGMCVPACQAAAASQGSVGCDFVVATPSYLPNFDGGPIVPPCFAVFLANNWPLDSVVTITRGGASYDAATFGRVPNGTVDAASWPAVPSTGIASSNVGVLFLSADTSAAVGTSSPACPITPAIDAAGGAAVYNGSNSDSGIGTAFHITTSMPVSAYDILPYGGASSFLPSAELVLPTTAWGTNYVTAGSKPTTGPGWGTVVAAMDNTMVQITPTDALPAGPSVAAAPAGQTTTYTLNAGQFVQWEDSGDMAGSVITASNPVAYTGGTGYLCLSDMTSSGGGCDSSHQEIPPVSALGSEYVAPPYATRRSDLQPESVLYRIVGTVAGTTLTYSPAVTGAPTTIGVGQVVEFESTTPFIVTSQDAMHPFYVGQYMTGCYVTGGSRPGDGSMGCLGDEEYVNILPPAQWLQSYVFFTDPTYTTTNLVVTRAADASGTFHDVTVDCLGTLTGWQNVNDGTKYQITNADLQRDTPVGSCTNGRHTASSAGAFNIMVWGLAYFASYAYPAGGNVGKINPVVVIQ
ncbi:MAG TPA: IgGFc-binding protein [Kofleriaceae bacterium]|nr:IgGFc-binding protein [Kofleriaceae bacterium]